REAAGRHERHHSGDGGRGNDTAGDGAHAFSLVVSGLLWWVTPSPSNRLVRRSVSARAPRSRGRAPGTVTTRAIEPSRAGSSSGAAAADPCGPAAPSAPIPDEDPRA